MHFTEMWCQIWYKTIDGYSIPFSEQSDHSLENHRKCFSLLNVTFPMSHLIWSLAIHVWIKIEGVIRRAFASLCSGMPHIIRFKCTRHVKCITFKPPNPQFLLISRIIHDEKCLSKACHFNKEKLLWTMD